MLNKKKSKKGFTLVELLVVIAIIGILAVVAVPALFKNINKAKVADVEADYNAIKSATLSYYTDNNELPMALTKLTGNDEKKDLDDYMDSVPTEAAFNGIYSLVESTDNGNNEVGSKAKEKSLFLQIEGVKITKDQMKKLLADMGSNMVFIGANQDADTYAPGSENNAEITKNIRIKMIDNTSSIAPTNPQ